MEEVGFFFFLLTSFRLVVPGLLCFTARWQTLFPILIVFTQQCRSHICLPIYIYVHGFKQGMHAYISRLWTESEVCHPGNSKRAFKHDWVTMVFQFCFVFFWIRDEAAGDGRKWAQDWEGLTGQKDGRLADGGGGCSCWCCLLRKMQGVHPEGGGALLQHPLATDLLPTSAGRNNYQSDYHWLDCFRVIQHFLFHFLLPVTMRCLLGSSVCTHQWPCSLHHMSMRNSKHQCFFSWVSPSQGSLLEVNLRGLWRATFACTVHHHKLQIECNRAHS